MSESQNWQNSMMMTRKKLTGSSTALQPGRPPMIDNDSLIETIVCIAIVGSAADERRRTEVILTVKTLDQLMVALQKEGYQLQRSSVHMRLLPKSARTTEGKQHARTAPVKLFQAFFRPCLQKPQ